jgi:Crp-like helix-turn-helix domain
LPDAFFDYAIRYRFRAIRDPSCEGFVTNMRDGTLRPGSFQEMLAEMVGTTRSRVNFFMNKFRKLGLIKYNGGLQINESLLSVVLHD